MTEVFSSPHVYLVTTNHPEFRRLDAPSGSTVIDPWGTVQAPGPGAKIERVGRHSPAKISLLVPSRGRPDQFARMVNSALETTTHPRQLEVAAYLDDDDPSAEHYLAQGLPVRWTRGPRIVLSEMWNRCYETASGEIFMHCGDDIVFRTNNWDTMVRREFERWPDRIVLVQGDDLSPNREALATHGFLHRRWVETLGYFVPPLFSSDWNDVWLTELADAIDRRVRLPFVTDHMHYTFGKADRDQTHADREERGLRDNVVELYQQTKRERKRDVAKLQEAINGAFVR